MCAAEPPPGCNCAHQGRQLGRKGCGRLHNLHLLYLFTDATPSPRLAGLRKGPVTRRNSSGMGVA